MHLFNKANLCMWSMYLKDEGETGQRPIPGGMILVPIKESCACTHPDTCCCCSPDLATGAGQVAFQDRVCWVLGILQWPYHNEGLNKLLGCRCCAACALWCASMWVLRHSWPQNGPHATPGMGMFQSCSSDAQQHQDLEQNRKCSGRRGTLRDEAFRVIMKVDSKFRKCHAGCKLRAYSCRECMLLGLTPFRRHGCGGFCVVDCNQQTKVA